MKTAEVETSPGKWEVYPVPDAPRDVDPEKLACVAYKATETTTTGRVRVRDEDNRIIGEWDFTPW